MPPAKNSIPLLPEWSENRTVHVSQTGILITFEGIDGCGKSTQMARAADFFQSLGHAVVSSREPGGSSIGPAVRSLLLESPVPPCPLAEALLFSADRAQHVTERIRPALSEGKIVLLDRHTDSTLAYQGFGSGQDLAILRTLNTLATGGLVPHATILLDLDPAEAAARMSCAGRTPDRFEREGGEFFQRVRQGFLRLASSEPGRISVIDANQPLTMVSEEVNTCLKRILLEYSHA